MEASNHPLYLRYSVKLRDAANPMAIVRDMRAGFASMGSSKKLLTNPNICDDDEIKYSYVPETDTYDIELQLDGETFEIDIGGISRIATIIFGNQFRHELIEWARLLEIEFSPSVATTFGGPNFGSASIKTFLDKKNEPILSFPLPVNLEPNIKETLIDELVSNDVSIITESPLGNTNYEEIGYLSNYLEELCERRKKKLIYFFNGTMNLDEFEQYAISLQSLISTNVLFGFRLCPLSMGLNTVTWIKNLGVPIYGYNLLTIGSKQYGFEVSPRAMAILFRMAGCDAVNIGLKYQSIKHKSSAAEFVSSCIKSIDSIKATLPMFTGGITPRVCYEIVSQFHLVAGLHIKKPLLRNGKNIRRNLRAYQESTQLALSAIDIDDAIGRESKATSNIRSYEKDYGREQ